MIPAKKTFYNGRTFDSKSEAEFAAELDMRVRVGDIKDWEAQFPIEFMANGKLIGHHYIDFLIIHNHGQRELIEHKGKKGQETDLWKWKRKMLFAYYGIGFVTDYIRYKRKNYKYTLHYADASWKDKYKK